MSLDFLEILGRRKKIKYHKVGSGQIWPPHLWQSVIVKFKLTHWVADWINQPGLSNICERASVTADDGDRLLCDKLSSFVCNITANRYNCHQKLSQQMGNGCRIMPLHSPGGSTLQRVMGEVYCVSHHLFVFVWQHATTLTMILSFTWLDSCLISIWNRFNWTTSLVNRWSTTTV